MEKRVIQSNFEIRAKEGEPTKIVGTAAIVNNQTVLFEEKRQGVTFRLIEILKPGAFNDVLKTDVRALFNHDPNMILGRTTAGTMRIALNDKGDLIYEVDPPNTTYANDLQESIKRGDISQSSFGFDFGDVTRTVKETDTEYIVTRTVNTVAKLYDVSPVTYPATEETVTEMRSKFAGEFKKEQKELKTPNLDKVNQRLRTRK